MPVTKWHSVTKHLSLRALNTRKSISVLASKCESPPANSPSSSRRKNSRIPLNVLAFISIKASKKMNGLVNVSGFHVDPGFSGRLKFSVYNAGSQSTVLDVGVPLFPIWFYELPEPNEDDYHGKHYGQCSISSADVEQLQGQVSSPAALQKQIDDLRSTVSTWKALTASGFAAVLSAAIGIFLTRLLE